MAQPQRGTLLHRNRWVLIILPLAVVVRLPGLFIGGLWYDELQSVTHAALPLPTLLKSVRAFDPHPPLYYIQLHFWMLAGTGDPWLRLNSLLWSVLTVVSLFFIARRLYGSTVATLAALFFALSPFAVFYAQEVRMYALLSFLGLWSFYFTRRFLIERPTAGNGLAAVLFTLTFLYIHGAGFLLLTAIYAYAALMLFQRHAENNSPLRKFMLLQLLIFFAYIPWLLHASQLDIGRRPPDLNEIFTVLGFLIFGFNKYIPLIFRAAGVVAFAVALASAMRFSASRWRNPLLAFVVVPPGVCLGVSIALRFIWQYRALAWMTPFLALAFAAVIGEIQRWAERSGLRHRTRIRLHRAAIGTVATLFLFGVVAQTIRPPHRGDFMAAARFLDEKSLQGEKAYIPSPRALWGFAWYALGPGSVNPLEGSRPATGPNGIALYSRLSWENAGKPSVDWIIGWNEPDAIDSFGAQSVTLVRSFNHLDVFRVHASPESRTGRSR